MAGEAAERLMTVDEFLVWDDGTDIRYELVDGRLRAMAPPSEAHGTIVANIVQALAAHLPPGCRIVTEAGIRPLADAATTYFQADLAVTCTGRPQDGDGLKAPILIVEVLSPSTELFDRGRKARDYAKLPSVREILLVDSLERRVQLWSRQEEGWLVRDFIGEAGVPLEVIQGPVGLAAIYRGF